MRKFSKTYVRRLLGYLTLPINYFICTRKYNYHAVRLRKRWKTTAAVISLQRITTKESIHNVYTPNSTQPSITCNNLKGGGGQNVESIEKPEIYEMMMHPNCILCSHIADVHQKVLRMGKWFYYIRWGVGTWGGGNQNANDQPLNTILRLSLGRITGNFCSPSYTLLQCPC